MSSEQRFECNVRLTAAGVAITSPRTGRTLELSHARAPRRLRGRIVQARSVGRATVAFTPDELRALKDAAAAA